MHVVPAGIRVGLTAGCPPGAASISLLLPVLPGTPLVRLASVLQQHMDETLGESGANTNISTELIFWGEHAAWPEDAGISCGEQKADGHILVSTSLCNGWLPWEASTSLQNHSIIFSRVKGNISL